MVDKKTKLTVSDVSHVADLAKLSLTPKELKKFQSQLSEVLNYVSQLSELNTQNIESTSQVTGLENVFRDDETQPSLTQKETLSQTKQSQGGFFKVKAIFEQ